MTRAHHAVALALGVLVLAGAPGSSTAEEDSESTAAVSPSPVVADEADVADDDYDPLFDEEFDDELSDGSDGDPWEPMNRKIFSFNNFMDRWILDPITDAYQFIVPAVFRDGLNNVFLNLQSPVIIVNHLLQLRGKDALDAAGRFVINTTAGGGGFFDAAGRGANIPRVDADFGQTLASWGTPPGPYLVIPVLGPSTLRDATGDVGSGCYPGGIFVSASVPAASGQLRCPEIERG